MSMQGHPVTGSDALPLAGMQRELFHDRELYINRIMIGSDPGHPFDVHESEMVGDENMVKRPSQEE